VREGCRDDGRTRVRDLNRKRGRKEVLVMYVLDMHFLNLLWDCIERFSPWERSRDWGHARWKANICGGWRKGRDDFAIFHVIYSCVCR